MPRPPREPRTPAPGMIARTDRMLIPAPGGSLGTLGDPGEADFRHRLGVQLMDWPRMNIGAFARESWRVKLLTESETDELVLLLEKFLNGGWRKLSELHKGDGLDPVALEVHVVETWGQGRYRLTPEWRGKEYPPRSRAYDLGTDPLAGPTKKDTAALIAEAAEAVGQTVTLSQLKALERPAGEGDDMKVTDLAALITALEGRAGGRTDPALAEILRQNQETQKAILEELKALKEKGARSPSELAALVPALAPVLGTLLRPFAKNPDVLMGVVGKWLGIEAPAAPKSWADGLLELIGPALQSPTAQALIQALAQRLVVQASAPEPAAPPPAALPGHAYAPMVVAAPTPNGGQPAPASPAPLPLTLNAAQQHALEQFTAYVAAGDFVNGYGCLEMFPASDPLPGAPMGVNLGDAWLSSLDSVKRTADARVAVPSLRALAPGLDPTRAAEFIAYAQGRLIDEEDRAIAARAAGEGDEEPEA